MPNAPHLRFEIRIPPSLHGPAAQAQRQTLMKQVWDVLPTPPDFDDQLPAGTTEATLPIAVQQRLDQYNTARGVHALPSIDLMKRLDDGTSVEGVRYVWIDGVRRCIREYRVTTQLLDKSGFTGVEMWLLADSLLPPNP